MSSPHARYIWVDKTGTGRNRYVLFRRTFSLLGPKTAHLNIFADTRYRLMLNGHIVGHGPARFFVAKPEYDTWDLTPYLRTGRNALAVIVNSYGCLSFHNEASIGGLIAWGLATDKTGRVVRIATDDSWRAIESPGHLPDAPSLSFALNPAELLDARAMPTGWELPTFDDHEWPFAIPHRRQEHWGQLQPRSIPLLDERPVTPRRRLGAWAARLDPDEQIYSLMLTSPTGRSLHTLAKVAAFTYIHSPIGQIVTFGAWWGRHWINGQELKGVPRSDVALRHDFTAQLNEGWNTLFVYETIRYDWWDFRLALPRVARLAVSAEKMLDSPHTFLVGGPWEDALAADADSLALPLSSPTDLPEGFGGWRPWPREKHANAPSRERAWKKFEKLNDDTSLHVNVAELAPQVRDNTLCLLFDFGTEVLGRPIIDFKAAAGTILDLTYTERLRPDGLADVHARHFVDMAERYIARQGCQQWQTFHPRGFRYLELLITGDLTAFELYDLALSRANYPVQSIGTFQCSDPALNEIWRLGQTTLHACMEDAYLDCPSRERGLYAGDSLVQFLVNLACFGDVRLFRRCIDLFLLAQGENGLVPSGAHGLPPGKHPDYSALIPQTLWQYYARTGDLAFLRYALPHLKRLMKGLQALRSPGSDLINGSDLQPYIDLCFIDKDGANCALNCFCQRAFHDAARIMNLIDQDDLARSYAQQAETLAQAIRQSFWDQTRGVFLDRLPTEVPDTQPSVPANALPVFYDIATPHQASLALPWLVQAMLNNFRAPEPTDNRHCNVTSYFSFYALGALYRHGHFAEAEQFMRKYWTRMLDQGAWTCWEYFIDSPNASRCHAWSASPTHYLSTQVLGVTFPHPANLHKVLIRPHSALQWASGVYPHPDGPIRVAWQRRNGIIMLEYQAPPGVQVIT